MNEIHLKTILFCILQIFGVSTCVQVTRYDPEGKCRQHLQIKINLLSLSKGHVAGKQYLQATKRFNTINYIAICNNNVQ